MNVTAILQLIGLLASLAALVWVLPGRRLTARCCRPVVVLVLVVGALSFALNAIEHGPETRLSWIDPYGDAVTTLWPVAWFLLFYGLVVESHRRVVEERNARLAAALDELRQAQDCLARDERLRAIGEMAAGVAHDFNNRLTVVLTSGELLLQSDLTEQDRETATQIVRAAEDAADVVRRMNDFARPGEAGALERIQMHDLIESCVALTRPHWSQRRPHGSGRIEVDLHAEGRPDFVGTRRDLVSAITNLIFNAVDALPDGGRIVLTGSVSDDCVVLEVSDDGVGMDAATVAAATEPFFSTKEHERGTGLGLSIVRTVAESHGGRVEIDSHPGEGTSVRVVMPRVTLARDAPPMADGDSAGAGLNVLVVDDNEHVRWLLGRMLEMSGHRVVQAADGREGYEALLSGPIDVVLLDRIMPGVGGDEAARQMKDMCPGVPIVMMTGYGGLVRDDGFLPPGVDATLEKPIPHSTLRRTLATVCRRHDNAVESS